MKKTISFVLGFVVCLALSSQSFADNRSNMLATLNASLRKISPTAKASNDPSKAAGDQNKSAHYTHFQNIPEMANAQPSQGVIQAQEHTMRVQAAQKEIASDLRMELDEVKKAWERNLPSDFDPAVEKDLTEYVLKFVNEISPTLGLEQAMVYNADKNAHVDYTTLLSLRASSEEIIQISYQQELSNLSSGDPRSGNYQPTVDLKAERMKKVLVALDNFNSDLDEMNTHLIQMKEIFNKVLPHLGVKVSDVPEEDAGSGIFVADVLNAISSNVGPGIYSFKLVFATGAALKRIILNASFLNYDQKAVSFYQMDGGVLGLITTKHNHFVTTLLQAINDTEEDVIKNTKP